MSLIDYEYVGTCRATDERVWRQILLYQFLNMLSFYTEEQIFFYGHKSRQQ